MHNSNLSVEQKVKYSEQISKAWDIKADLDFMAGTAANITRWVAATAMITVSATPSVPLTPEGRAALWAWGWGVNDGKSAPEIAVFY